MRKKYSVDFKSKVALEALKGDKGVKEIASYYNINPDLVRKWKNHLLKNIANIFLFKEKDVTKSSKERFEKEIKELKAELEWMKKGLKLSDEEKKLLIDKENSIPIYKQCELLGIPRSSFYYKPKGEDSYNNYLMELIREQHAKYSSYGIYKMTAWLRSIGHKVNHKRVARLMNKLGIKTSSKRKLSSKDNKEYHYLYKVSNS